MLSLITTLVAAAPGAFPFAASLQGAAAGGPGPAGSSPVSKELGGTVAVRAGTIHLVEQGRVLSDGATLLLRDGRIVAVGTEVEVPRGTQVIDYGPDAVIVPGFVAADSSLADGQPSDRTAAPDLAAVDGFDFYAHYTSALAAGVTSAYIAPARSRLISGHGAVVSLGSGTPEERVLNRQATIHGSIAAEARNAPGYWEPPIPATSDRGLGLADPELPRSTMGAILALTELLEGVAAGRELPPYGPRAVASLRELLGAGAAWRITAVEEHEIRALLEFARQRQLELLVDGAHFAGELAQELAQAGAGVIYEVPFRPNQASNSGAVTQRFLIQNGYLVEVLESAPGAPADRRPELDVPARLAAAGVPVAIAPARGTDLRDLRFAAAIASRGGLSAEQALAAITLVPARFYGVDREVGSLAPGKRADFVVLNGPPLEPGSSVRATWVGGRTAYEPRTDESAGLHSSTVISVDELHVGDGTVLSPGEVLLRNGRVVEVGRRVSRPSGTVVVRGAAAMPGMIDAGGRLGLGGSRRTPATDFDLAQIAEPGDETDRAVARAGVTTVLLDPPGESASGVPMLAYRPAAEDFDHLVIDGTAALRFQWSDANRLESGVNLRKVLEKAVEYRDQWRDYERKLAEWKPEPVAPEFRLPPTEEEQPEGAAASAEGAKEGEAAEGDKDKEDDKKKKKKKDQEPDPDPVTGIWLGEITDAGGAAVRTRMQIRLEEGAVSGFLRSALLSPRLLEVAGQFGPEGALVLSGSGVEGAFRLDGKLSALEKDAEEVLFEGTLHYGATELAFSLPRTGRDYPVAQLPEGPPKAAPTPEEPKGKPKAPREDKKLEPLRRALEGQAAVVVAVERAHEILDCVEAFEAVGLRPILLGAGEAVQVADRIAGRVAGILLDPRVVTEGVEEERGYRLRNRYADLQSAGIPVAFRSEAEGGAADLPLMAAYAVAHGLSPIGAVRALTADAARMFAIDDRVGLLATGRDGDVLLLDGSPLELSTGVQRVWVAGREVR